MATSGGGSAAETPAKSEATQFVDALYRKVLLAVKASNGVPSEDDDYHYHCKFSSVFAAQAESTTTRVQNLLWKLSKSSAKGGNTSDDEDEEEDEARSCELFEGPEPKPRITDLVDTLLDEASRQLEIVARGDTGATPTQRMLENKPMVFDKSQEQKKKSKSDREEEVATRSRQTRATNKPQEKFEETIDNSHAPFASKLREKVHAIHEAIGEEDDADMDGEEAARHPYYPEIRALKYADWQVQAASTPYEKVPIENASYLWVDNDDKLREMMKSLLKEENRVIAIDLEHHSYRSYLGLVCLMQVSTACEDFLVDTLALRNNLQVLNEVFCDPAKVKVLHGSDMDILWLQRDLGLYIVNMFDTGQAARLLNYPRFSLAYLLKRHCGIDADKQYQLADWRVRPLEKNMIKYAREDTRYLLYIYDQMKQELLASSDSSRSSLLLDALRNSTKICLQVYDKPEVSAHDCDALSEKLKTTVGIPVLSDLQKRVFERMYYWRDEVARAEDESHAYVMPNHVLIKIATQLPQRSDSLFRTCHPVPPLVRKHAHEITKIIVAEKSKLSESTAPVAASSGEVTKKIEAVPTHKRKFSDVNDATFSSNSASGRLNHVAWLSGKRKAQESVNTCDATSLESCFQLGDVRAVDEDVVAALERVNALVTSTSFSVSEYAVESVADSRIEEPEEPRFEPKVKEEAEAQSLTDTYQLSNRTKRRKLVTPSAPTAEAVATVQASVRETTEKTEEFMKQIEEASASTKPFDYAAASKTVAGAQFKLDAAPPAPTGGRGGGRGQKKKVGGRGYNPFVAVRGGKAAAHEEPEGAKAPIKKIHHMPRSSTFR